MTTKETAEASADSKPGEGEILVYIDWQGKKLFAPVTTKPTKKSKEETQ